MGALLARSVLAWIALATVGVAFGAPPLVTGDEHAAWLVSRDAHGRVLLLFLPPEAEDGVAHVAAAFPSEPLAIACEDDAALLVFPPHTGEDARSDLYPIRRVRREDDPATRELFGAPQAMAPLQVGGEVVGLALVDARAYVLLEDDAGVPRLRALRDNAWRPVALPELPGGARLHLARFGATLALLAESGEGGRSLWLGESLDPGTERWSSRSIPVGRPVVAVLPIPSGLRILSRDPETPASLDVLEFRGAELTPMRTIADADSASAGASWGTGLALVHADTDLDSGLGARLFDAGGVTVHDGPITIAGPISPAEVQLLVVLLSSVFLTAVVFVLRPEPRSGRALQFPDNASLASPARRTAAFCVDLAPGLVVAGLVWFLDAGSLEEVSSILAERGAAPILTAAAITILHSTIGEATTGRTIGKALTRCRTIGFDGSRPGWKQSLARNAVKVLCPPLGLFVLMGPASVHPGSFDTLVIVDHPPTPPGVDQGPAGRSDGPSDPSDRP